MKRIQAMRSAIRPLLADRDTPLVIALDGGSGSGKSTIADEFQRQSDCALIRFDDFYNTTIPETEWPRYTIHERLRHVFDWDAVRRSAIIPLQERRAAVWYPFDFQAGLNAAGTYDRMPQPVTVAPAEIVLIDGAYSASPALADLIDVAVLVDVPCPERHRRLALREDSGFLQTWHAIWDEVEAYYFTRIRPPSSFDLVIKNPSQPGAWYRATKVGR